MVTFLSVFAAVILIGALLLAIIALTRQSGGRLDIEKYRTKWLAIENQLTREDTASHQLCVLNADKLLDQALRERGTKGDSMGARMKAVQSWSNANGVWTAHKLRNQIAHEPDVRVQYEDSRRALAGFKQALKDLGAI